MLTCPQCADITVPPANECESCGATLVLGFMDNGYWTLRLPGHHLAQRGGKVRAHRLIAERQIGRPLAPGEVVHHLNEDKLDNRPENLVVCASNAEHHRRFHGRRAA